MGVNIIASSRAELEFEECPYCHSKSAVKYEYITAATGAWDVVKYTCLECANQFIYDCRVARPSPILVQGARENWLHEYTIESQVWRDRLGYKKIEKPKEESMGCTDDDMSNYEKFKQPIGSIVEFEGESYVVSEAEPGSTCGSCDLLGVCSVNDWLALCEKGKYYKKVKASDMKSVKDACKFAVDEFDEKVEACHIGDTMEFNGKTYTAVDQAPYEHGCYDCDLCDICQDLHFGGEFCEVCDPDVIFKEVEQKEEARQEEAVSDDVAIFHDYSKDPFEKLYEFNTGFKFRFGNKMYEAMAIEDADLSKFSCGQYCDLCDYCYSADGEYRTVDCPGHRYFKECCTKKQSDDKDYQGDLRTVFSFPVGHEFRYGDSKVAVRKSRYAKEEDSHLDCADCAFRKECGEADAGCPSDKWYEVIGKSEPKEEPKKEEAKPVDMKKDYSTGDFKEIFKLNDGDEFRFGDAVYKALSKDPSKWDGCDSNCDMYDYCYNEDGALYLETCPGSRYYKKLGYVFNRCPSCGEYALKACLNAARSGGVSKHVLNVSMVPGSDGIPEVDKQEIERMTDAATVVCTICGSRHGSLGSWKQQFKPVHSFIDDGDKLVDFFKLTKEEFLKSYSYLTEEEYEATLEAIKSRTK